jgi:hypothetical protein
MEAFFRIYHGGTFFGAPFPFAHMNDVAGAEFIAQSAVCAFLLVDDGGHGPYLYSLSFEMASFR